MKITEEINIGEYIDPLPKQRSEIVRLDMIVDSAKQQARDRILFNIASQQLDAELLPRASRPFWDSGLSVIPCCEACYREYREEEWDGEVDHPFLQKRRRATIERIEDGVVCTICKRSRIAELKREIAEEIEIEFEIVDEQGEYDG